MFVLLPCIQSRCGRFGHFHPPGAALQQYFFSPWSPLMDGQRPRPKRSTLQRKSDGMAPVRNMASHLHRGTHVQASAGRCETHGELTIQRRLSNPASSARAQHLRRMSITLTRVDSSGCGRTGVASSLADGHETDINEPQPLQSTNASQERSGERRLHLGC